MLQLEFLIIHSIYIKFKNLKLARKSFEASVTLRRQQALQTLLRGITQWQGGTRRWLQPGCAVAELAAGLHMKQGCGVKPGLKAQGRGPKVNLPSHCLFSPNQDSLYRCVQWVPGGLGTKTRRKGGRGAKMLRIWEGGGTPGCAQPQELLPSRARGNHVKTPCLHFLLRLITIDHS